MHYNGAKNTSTPYRSVSRVNKLLGSTTYQAQYGTSKLVEFPAGVFTSVNQKLNDYSKPCSVTTTLTQATAAYTEYSTYKEDSVSTRKRDTKRAKANNASNTKVGSKRQAQLRIGMSTPL